jgi:protein-S-isoprenylcysteine O-methyltransferase Ste14
LRSKIFEIGRFLYHYRGIIAFPFFVLLVIFARPTPIRPQAILFIVTGLIIRAWAAGYIGGQSRQRSYSSTFRINNGPFHYLQHPLYIGNLMLVLGVVILFNPQTWLFLTLPCLFVLEYTLIIISEHQYLRTLPSRGERFCLKNMGHEWSTYLVMAVILVVYLLRVWRTPR